MSRGMSLPRATVGVTRWRRFRATWRAWHARSESGLLKASRITGWTTFAFFAVMMVPAIALAKRGARVIMACRSGIPEAGEEVRRASGGVIEMLPVDLASFASVLRLCHALANERLDVTVLNAGVVPSMVQRIGVPEERQQIFQSHAAALEETKHGGGVTLALGFAVAQDLSSGALVRVPGRGMAGQGSWHISLLGGQQATPAAEEMARFVTTPRATQAMLRGRAVSHGRFKPAVHVTLWS